MIYLAHKKKTHKKDNPYKHRQVKKALRREHLPKHMWTRDKFTEEVKLINPNIDISKIPLNVMKELFLLYKEEHRIDEYQSIYFFFLNKEYIKTLTPKDVDEMSKMRLRKEKPSQDKYSGKAKSNKAQYNKDDIKRCRELLPPKWRYYDEFKH